MINKMLLLILVSCIGHSFATGQSFKANETETANGVEGTLQENNPNKRKFAAAPNFKEKAGYDILFRDYSYSLEAFFGEPLLKMTKLWEGRGGRNIVIAKDGSVLAFNGALASNSRYMRKSTDGGMTWNESQEVSNDAGGNAVVNEGTGEIMLISPDGYRWISRDHGESWQREVIEIFPDGFGHGTPDGIPVNLGAMQQGITLIHGEHKGRLLMPARVFGPENSYDVKWRSYHYSTSIYSDDGGTTWQTSKPFPILGTGEAALAEISDGSILYNSREHMSKGNRYIAWSYDGGETWLDASRSDYLPDGVRGSSYGCMGGMIRLPVEGEDILIYSNLDTDAGVMPEQVGGTTSDERENITVWVSFDGGKTWPVKRLVFDGPSAYSTLGVGRAGTSSEGKVYLLFEGGPEHHYAAVNVGVFNLSWLLEDHDTNEILKKRNTIE